MNRYEKNRIKIDSSIIPLTISITIVTNEAKNVRKKNGRKKKVEDTRGKILTTALTIKNSQGRSMTQTPCFSNVASIPRDIVTEEEEREEERKEKKRTWKREVSRCSLVSRFPIPPQPPS